MSTSSQREYPQFFDKQADTIYTRFPHSVVASLAAAHALSARSRMNWISIYTPPAETTMLFNALRARGIEPSIIEADKSKNSLIKANNMAYDPRHLCEELILGRTYYSLDRDAGKIDDVAMVLSGAGQPTTKRGDRPLYLFNRDALMEAYDVKTKSFRNPSAIQTIPGVTLNSSAIRERYILSDIVENPATNLLRYFGLNQQKHNPYIIEKQLKDLALKTPFRQIEFVADKLKEHQARVSASTSSPQHNTPMS